jgi:hypothetical protein
MNNEQISWFEEALLGKSVPWSDARTTLLDHFDTPYRKFLLMTEVGSLCQEKYETNREYASRFQKMRREAGMEDNTQLAVTFFVSLREPVRIRSQQAITCHFGNKLPTCIGELIDLVIATGDDSSLLGLNNKRARLDSGSGSSATMMAPSKTNVMVNKGIHSSRKGNNYKYSRGPNPASGSKLCNYCKKVTWFHGHKCQEFLDVKGKNNPIEPRFQPINRMAHSSGNQISDYEDINMQVNRLALECKHKHKNTITKDFMIINDSIVFPLLIIRENEASKRIISILDTGANHSSINKDLYSN